METAEFDELLEVIRTTSPEELHAIFSDADTVSQLLSGMTPKQMTQVMVAKNVKLFGGINQYVEDFLIKGVPRITAMEEGPAKESIKNGQRLYVETMLTYDDLSAENKEKLEASLHSTLAAAPSAGGKRKWKMPRKMTRRYCKKTSCRKMGFTQKASCRPWKNCY